MLESRRRFFLGHLPVCLGSGGFSARFAANCVGRYWQALMKLCSSENWELDPFNNTPLPPARISHRFFAVCSLDRISWPFGHCLFDKSNYVFIIVSRSHCLHVIRRCTRCSTAYVNIFYSRLDP
jgi:hypothetical protein